MGDILYKKESYQVMGKCYEVFNELGRGFNEIVYKDALEWEFCQARIPFLREEKFEVNYKGSILPHYYFADFLIMDKIILEVKSVDSLVHAHVGQTINYLAVSKCRLGLLVNFGQESLTYKRILL